MDTEILDLAAVPVAWSLVMLFWMAGTRLPAMKKLGINMSDALGVRRPDIAPNVPPIIAWKSHNYAHLKQLPWRLACSQQPKGKPDHA